MLVLSRKIGEKLLIGKNVVVQIVGVKGGRVTVGIEAPREVRVRRAELPDEPREESEAAA